MKKIDYEEAEEDVNIGIGTPMDHKYKDWE